MASVICRFITPKFADSVQMATRVPRSSSSPAHPQNSLSAQRQLLSDLCLHSGLRRLGMGGVLLFFGDV